jgi:hypothetical protein
MTQGSWAIQLSERRIDRGQSGIQMEIPFNYVKMKCQTQIQPSTSLVIRFVRENNVVQGRIKRVMRGRNNERMVPVSGDWHKLVHEFEINPIVNSQNVPTGNTLARIHMQAHNPQHENYM